MARKSFKTPPKKPALSPELERFADKGAGTDQAEAVSRLSLNIPDDLKKRFKSACAISGTKMTAEVIKALEKHVAKLENHAS